MVKTFTFDMLKLFTTISTRDYSGSLSSNTAHCSGQVLTEDMTYVAWAAWQHTADCKWPAPLFWGVLRCTCTERAVTFSTGSPTLLIYTSNQALLRTPEDDLLPVFLFSNKHAKLQASSQLLYWDVVLAFWRLHSCSFSKKTHFATIKFHRDCRERSNDLSIRKAADELQASWGLDASVMKWYDAVLRDMKITADTARRARPRVGALGSAN